VEQMDRGIATRDPEGAITESAIKVALSLVVTEEIRH